MPNAPTSAYANRSDEDLLQLLFTEEDRLPRAAVEELLGRGARMGPRLAAIVEDAELWNAAPPRWWAPIHAVYLLAALKPPGALDVLLRALRKADEMDVDWIYDVASDFLSTFGPEAVPVLQGLLFDASASHYLRVMSLSALEKIAAAFPKARPEALEIMRAVLRNRMLDPELRAWAGSTLLPFAAAEDQPPLLEACDGRILNRQQLAEIFASGKPVQSERRRDWLEFYDPQEIAERQRRREEEERLASETSPLLENAPPVRPPEFAPELPDELFASDGPGRLARAGEKIGRNDPCPCGSGAKYKKCCGG